MAEALFNLLKLAIIEEDDDKREKAIEEFKDNMKINRPDPNDGDEEKKREEEKNFNFLVNQVKNQMNKAMNNEVCEMKDKFEDIKKNKDDPLIKYLKEINFIENENAGHNITDENVDPNTTGGRRRRKSRRRRRKSMKKSRKSRKGRKSRRKTAKKSRKNRRRRR